MNSESWITVRHINGDEECFDYVENLSAKDLKDLLNEPDPTVSIEIINGSDVLKDNFLFDKDTRYVLDLLKSRSLYSYHQELYDLLYDKTVQVVETEIYYCYSVEYCNGVLTLRIRTIRCEYTDIIYHREFYYKEGYSRLNFDRYCGESGIVIHKFEEFGNSFEPEIRNFMDELIKKCKFEEEKRDYKMNILFNMPDDRDEIINSMSINAQNNYVDYFESDAGSDYDYYP